MTLNTQILKENHKYKKEVHLLKIMSPNIKKTEIQSVHHINVNISIKNTVRYLFCIFYFNSLFCVFYQQFIQPFTMPLVSGDIEPHFLLLSQKQSLTIIFAKCHKFIIIPKRCRRCLSSRTLNHNHNIQKFMKGTEFSQ